MLGVLYITSKNLGCRSFILKKKMEKITVWLIFVYTASDGYFVSVFSIEKHSRSTVSYLKRLTNAALGRLQAFHMYGGIGMSASSLHRESTGSLIHSASQSNLLPDGPSPQATLKDLAYHHT